MHPQIGRAGFHIGFYVVFVSGGLLFFLERGSAEFVITSFTFILGLAFLAAIAVAVRLGQRKL
ncbi:hypothetical protein FKZ61_020485 [Litorilinea aerophila]|uniref:Uncharacterized protein n=1 Tax=Litorilinea aerophila TaxID=1204385 RepID=A0A540VAC1_9CHLR|nr:hypothetical protein [Litorilinea aerophila]MCC9078481.1 hypothetical protein [Litorilinea aerophila]OUC07038.1 hypothetical protein RY27_17320 [Litorilinea aerophila]GIV80068.1 MAG: hypothetical protein KatS3mg050_4462 [Litorilinea sp.]